MTMNITERDKRLLMLVACAVIIIVAFQYVILPAANDKTALQAELEEVTLLKQERELKLKALQNIDSSIEKNQEKLNKQKEDYYNYLQTREVDTIITNLALAHGLFPQSMSLTESKVGIVNDYIYFSQFTQRQIKKPSYLHIGTADIEVLGDAEQWTAFLDDILENFSGLRVVSFQLSETKFIQNTDESITADRISATFDIYMCFEEQPA